MKLRKADKRQIKNLSVFNAAMRYIKRPDRLEHPDGEFDNAGRWYPDINEGLDTSEYRSPSRAYPYSYMLACRTVKHCAKYEKVQESDIIAVKRAVKIIDANNMESFDEFCVYIDSM